MNSLITELYNDKNIKNMDKLIINASRDGNVNMMNELLAKGANKNATDDIGMTPLLYACVFGHADIVDILLHAGACNIAACMMASSPLIMATIYRRTDVVKVLVSYGEAIDEQDHNGINAITYAKRGGYNEIIELLEQ